MKHCTESRPRELWKYLRTKRVPESGGYPLARLIELSTERKETADDLSRVSAGRQLY